MILQQRTYKTFDLIHLAFKVAPFWALVMLIIRLIAAFVPAMLVIATANFIDTSVTVLRGDVRGAAMYLPVLVLGAIIAYQWMISDIGKFIRSKFLIATRLKYKMAIIEKRARLAYCHIENQDSYDLIKRVMDPSETKIIDQFDQTLSLLTLLIHTASLIGIIIINIWWAALLILIFTIPAVYIAMKAGKRVYQARRDLSKVERKAQYLTEVCSGREPALERMLFGFGKKMTNELWDRFEEVRMGKQKALKQEETNVAITGILLSSTAGIVMIALLQPVAANTITIGLFMSLVVASIDLTSWLTNTMPMNVRQFTENKEYLKDLTQFVQLEETIDALTTRCMKAFEFKKLEFRDVTFSYPETNKIILNKVNFVMEPERHYAFVGENGAGKTTVVKLLTGQYPDYEGEILLNGRELRSYRTSELKAVFSVAYQDFARYQMTVGENMRIGNLGSEDEVMLAGLMKDLELDKMIAGMSDGIDTPLGKIDEAGVDLSGGQWQRIALARTILNPAPVKILDEPTAALDPMSESRLYEQFEKIIQDRTSIFISHRLGSIKLADEILVFDEGRVAEAGSHENLMALDGKYAQMYKSQLEWYEFEEEVACNE